MLGRAFKKKIGNFNWPTISFIRKFLAKKYHKLTNLYWPLQKGNFRQIGWKFCIPIKGLLVELFESITLHSPQGSQPCISDLIVLIS